MKTTQIGLKRLTGILCPLLIMAFLFLPGISCKKNSAVTASTASLEKAVKQLDGELINGSISTESDDEGIALWCNNRKTLIGMAGLYSQALSNPGKIEHAQVVYSNFGVIILDIDTNRLWYYIQNDPQSEQKFQSLPVTGKPPVISGTAGTIKLHLS
jgi:hypothetical protein